MRNYMVHYMVIFTCSVRRMSLLWGAAFVVL